jgi:hypothetical protein
MSKPEPFRIVDMRPLHRQLELGDALKLLEGLKKMGIGGSTRAKENGPGSCSSHSSVSYMARPLGGLHNK